MAFSLTNVFNVTDTSALELNGAVGLATGVVGGRHLLFVAGADDNGITSFEITKSGHLKKVQALDDATNPAFLLDGALRLATVKVGTKSFLLATGHDDNAINCFEISKKTGHLINRDNVADDITRHLFFATDVLTATVGGASFAIVAGNGDDGLSVFKVLGNGLLANTDNVGDGGALELEGAFGLAKATIDGITYVFAAGITDDGVSVFSLAADGTLTNTDNVDDADDVDFRLDGVNALATAVVGTRTFLFAESYGPMPSTDDGISVFEVAANGTLSNVDNVGDDGTLNLSDAFAMTTAKIAGITYVFAGGQGDDGFSTFVVAADGTLLSTPGNVSDDGTLELTDLQRLSVAKVGTKFFLIASGRNDDGVSVFKINPEGLTILGTGGGNVVDATHSAPGQPLPSALGDHIFGFGSGDLLSGLGGNDRIDGGDGSDSLIGGKGRDVFDFNLTTESAVGTIRDVINDFHHSQHDKIDLKDIDANENVALDQAFKFIGSAHFTGHAGQLRFKHHVVQGDTDGDGTADFEIGVPHVAELVKGDFIL